MLILLIACVPGADETATPDGDSPVDSDSPPSDSVDTGDTGDPVDTVDSVDTVDTAPVDADGDGSTADVDCDDTNPAIHPGATETCDEVDEDCNGFVDDGLGPTWYPDFDGDGLGDRHGALAACSVPDGYTDDHRDCDDADPTSPVTLAGPLFIDDTVHAEDLDGWCAHGPLLLEGDLWWTQVEAEADLAHLGCLCAVDGTVHLENRVGKSPAGLDSLGLVTGDLTVYSASLTSFSGLGGLDQVDGSLDLSHTPELTDLGGLDSLRQIGQVLRIFGGGDSDPMQLQSLSGLDALERVGDVDLSELWYVSRLDGLGALRTVDGDFALEKMGITDLSPLALTSIGGSITLADMALDDVSGLGSPLHVYGDLRLSGDDAVTTLDLFAGIEEVDGDLEVTDCSALKSLSGLETLRVVGGDLELGELPYVADLSGLGAVEGLGGLRLYDDDALTTLDGIAPLTEIGGDLELGREAVDDYGVWWLQDNATLADIDALAGLTSVAGTIGVNGTRLTDLHALGAVHSAGGLWIDANPLLTNVDGLEGITTTGSVVIGYCHAIVVECFAGMCPYLDSECGNAVLTDLSGLGNLVEASEDFWILGNPALTTLTDLAAMDTVGVWLYIDHNPVLPDAEVQRFVDQLGTVGSVSIGENGG